MNLSFLKSALVLGILLPGMLVLSSCAKDDLSEFPAGQSAIQADRIVLGVEETGEPFLDEGSYCDEWFVFYKDGATYNYTVACAPWFSYDSVFAKSRVDVFTHSRPDITYPVINGTFSSLIIRWPEHLDYAAAEPQGFLNVEASPVQFHAADIDKDGLYEVEMTVDGEIINASDVLVSLSNSADSGGKIYRMIYNRVKDSYKEQIVVFWQQFPG